MSVFNFHWEVLKVNMINDTRCLFTLLVTVLVSRQYFHCHGLVLVLVLGPNFLVLTPGVKLGLDYEF